MKCYSSPFKYCRNYYSFFGLYIIDLWTLWILCELFFELDIICVATVLYVNKLVNFIGYYLDYQPWDLCGRQSVCPFVWSVDCLSVYIHCEEDNSVVRLFILVLLWKTTRPIVRSSFNKYLVCVIVPDRSAGTTECYILKRDTSIFLLKSEYLH